MMAHRSCIAAPSLITGANRTPPGRPPSVRRCSWIDGTTLSGYLIMFDRCPDQAAPLGPGAIVVLYPGIAKQLGEDEPGVAAPLAEAAIGDDWLLRGNPSLKENRSQLVHLLEGSIFVGGETPGDIPGSGDVPCSPRRIPPDSRAAGQLAPVLFRRAHIQQGRGSADRLAFAEYFVAEGPNGRVRFRRGIGGFRVTWHRGFERAPFASPLQPSTVHHPAIPMPEEGAEPKGVRGEPVVLVAIKYDGCVLADSLLRHKPLEGGTGDEIHAELVSFVQFPVNSHGAGNMPLVVQTGILA